MLPHEEATAAFVGAFVDELARSGIRHVCIAPGSRSAPLALTIARHPALRGWVHLDERSAAFFALGMARALGAPVALVCTSGTAAANFLPAVVEAWRAGVPLLVLTADRPPELRDVGAAQTIDQQRIYGSHAKWSVDVALPEATPAMLRYARTLACRAVAHSAAVPAGPVHLDLPFREPLVPVAGAAPSGLDAGDLLAWSGRPDSAPWVAIHDAAPAPSPVAVRTLVTLLAGACRPLIICGPQPDDLLAISLAGLAATLGIPILADPLSQLRWGAHRRGCVIDRYDAALRHDATAAALVPDLIVRVGAPPTSKALLQYVQRHDTVHQVVVDPARWPDPTLRASHVIHADPRLLADASFAEIARDAVSMSCDDEWLPRWQRLDATTSGALARHASSLAEPFEGAALAAVMDAVPAGATLFVSSSMPVRDLDAFAAGDDRFVRVLANRGANGIDGVVSTALGAAAALRAEGGGPLVLVVGDVALYHDLNGLLAVRQHEIDATIVLLNNDGGGIFSFLPQAGETEHFEHLFGTPHGLDFSHAAAMYGVRYSRTGTVAELRARLDAAIGAPGVDLVELRTERGRNVQLHHGAWHAVAAALEAGEAVSGS